MDMRNGNIVPDLDAVPEKERKYFVPAVNPDKQRVVIDKLQAMEKAYLTEKPTGKAAQRRRRQMQKQAEKTP